MIKKIFNIFHHESSGLHQAAMILAASSLLSGILGLFRDRLLAATFGAGQVLDIYYAAFKIPDFLYVLSLSLVSGTVLIPFFLERISVSSQEGRNFFDSVFTVFLFLIAGLSILAFFAAPHLSGLIAPGFSPEAKTQLILLTRILLLSPFFLGLSNILSSIIQSFNRFLVYALSPILYNLGIIFGIIFLLPRFGLAGLVMGVALGALLHASIQLPSILKLNFIPKIRLKINFSDIFKVITYSLPRSLGLGLNQLVIIFITAIASFLAVGSISVFNLSLNLQSVPLGIIGVSYSVAAFPTLAKLFVSDEKKKFLEQTVMALRQIIFWSIPLTILVIVLRAQIVRVILGAGRFDWNDTRLTAASLAIFIFSLLAQAIITLLVRCFYAAGKTLKPLLINIFSSVFIISGIFVSLRLVAIPAVRNSLEIFLRVGGVRGTEVLVLPLLFTLGSLINAFLLMTIFQKDFGHFWKEIKKSFYQIIFSSLVMAGAVYLALNIFDKIFNIRTFAGVFFQGFIAALFGLIFWFYLLCLMKNHELEEIISSLKQKFIRTPPIAPEPEVLP